LKQHVVRQVGGVDRRSPRGGRGLKQHVEQQLADLFGSLPARGAWIETPYVHTINGSWVAPRAGGVD